MSTTTIYKLHPGGSYEELEELRNAHGSAPVVWGKMFERFVGGEEFSYWSRTDELWPLWRRKDIAPSLRAVLAMTYDNAYVEREHYARAAADIRAFLTEFSLDPERANHWPRIAEVFESAPDCPAVGFQWTSVSENPFQGEWDEEAEDYGPTDWSNKWSLYREFDKRESE